MARSGSAENGPNAMACNTFGSIPAVSTNPIASSFRRLSTQCFAGIRMRSNATSIYQMFAESKRSVLRVYLGISFSVK